MHSGERRAYTDWGIEKPGGFPGGNDPDLCSNLEKLQDGSDLSLGFFSSADTDVDDLVSNSEFAKICLDRRKDICIAWALRCPKVANDQQCTTEYRQTCQESDDDQTDRYECLRALFACQTSPRALSFQRSFPLTLTLHISSLLQETGVFYMMGSRPAISPTDNGFLGALPVR